MWVVRDSCRDTVLPLRHRPQRLTRQCHEPLQSCTEPRMIVRRLQNTTGISISTLDKLNEFSECVCNFSQWKTKYKTSRGTFTS